MRKLASIQEAAGIAEIPGMDRIETVFVNGWSVIVKKGEYRIKDKLIYVEIDSLLPETEWSEFLRAKKFKIKTMKLRGQYLSQGICFPLSILPESYKGNYEIGEDVTDILGIKNFRRVKVPKESQGKPRTKTQKFLMRFRLYRLLFGNRKQRLDWPEWISKTDETRIENLTHYLKDKDIKYTVTRKLDGSSITYFIQKKKNWYGKVSYEFGICSRNIRKRVWDKRWVKHGDKPDQWFYCANKYGIKEKMIELFNIFKNDGFDALYIQGELVGPAIQQNKYKLNELDVFIFNIVLVNTKTGEKSHLDYGLQKLACEKMGLKQVPLVQTQYTLPDTVEELRKFVHGPSYLNPESTLEEGFVFRNYDMNRSFKCVDPEFLLKWDDIDEGEDDEELYDSDNDFMDENDVREAEEFYERQEWNVICDRTNNQGEDK